MKYLPLFVDVTAGRCLVVGGGAVAARKVVQLRKAEARVDVVAPEIGADLQPLLDGEQVVHHARGFEQRDVEGKRLVIAATDDEALNRQVAAAAQTLNIPVNVVDNPALCTFITPSTVDRSPVQIAVSTGGASPVLARVLRSRIEALLPSAYGELGSLLARYRDEVSRRIPKMRERRHFWETVVQGPVAEMVFAGRIDAAEQALRESLSDPAASASRRGEVYLVGAGPGDPDLLTLRALRLMQQADVVVYDRLVSAPILELVRRDARQVYAGKSRDQHALDQESINELLVRLAHEGNRVLRLKGGDPFIFGRGGEEIATLVEQGVPFQIVPGITAATGCATYAGIPLTHRDHAQACIFVTGHLRDGTVDLNYEMLAHRGQTVVVYMGLHGVAVLCEQLIAHGRASDTPAALIEQGTTPGQRVHIATLATLAQVVNEHKVKAPTIIIIGEVVALHSTLSWYQAGDGSRSTDAERFTGSVDGTLT